jgi:hypothetical protein
MAFANYRLRRIPVGPRRVHRSDTLTQRNDLSPNERAAIDAIEEKICAGVDLYSHQSTSLLDPLAKDGLLADWDIQHLHLGLADGRPTVAPFVNRSQKVLLARFTRADAYLIDCPPHGPDVEPPWWDTDLLETLHRNWPESIAHLRLSVDSAPDPTFAPPRLTWAQHRQMRPLRGFTITTALAVTDGTVYLLGSGLLGNGYSLQAGRCADLIMTRMVEKALAHTDDEKVVIRGDHREVHVYFEPCAIVG